MKQSPDSGRRNGIIIGCLVVFALILYFGLNSTSSGGSSTELKLVHDTGPSKPPSPPSPPYHKDDGGLFVIIKEREDHQCGTFSTQSTNPVSAMTNESPTTCLAISMGLLFHTIKPSVEISKNVAANSASKLAAWAKRTSHCGDVTVIVMPHGAGGPRVEPHGHSLHMHHGLGGDLPMTYLNLPPHISNHCTLLRQVRVASMSCTRLS